MEVEMGESGMKNYYFNNQYRKIEIELIARIETPTLLCFVVHFLYGLMITYILVKSICIGRRKHDDIRKKVICFEKKEEELLW